MKYLFWAAPLLGLAVAACGPNSTTGAEKPDLLRANLDTTVRPGDDFYNYANGAWFRQHPIPASESSWGIGKEVQNEVYARLRKLNEDAAKASAAPGSTQQQLGDFWATGLDSAASNRQGIAPLQAELTRIQGITTVTGVQAAIARLQQLGVNALLEPFVEQDSKNSDKMALHLW